jgi:Predicted membrane protein
MSTLIAIGYPDETTAISAAEEARRLARDVTLEPEAIAVSSRNRDGRFQVSTNHHPVGGGASWGMFWGLLFGFLFFIPVFGMAVGAGLGAVMGRVTRSGIDRQFRDQVRDMLEPGTSALFLVVDGGHAGPGRGGAAPVRGHRAQVFAEQAGRAGAAGGPLRRAGPGAGVVSRRC